MKTTFTALAAAATLSTATFAPLQANAAIETLGECYNAVITWCNETFPDHAECGSSGLSECDEEFGMVVGGGFDEIHVQVQPGDKFKWRLINLQEQIDDRESRDNDDRPSRPEATAEADPEPTPRPSVPTRPSEPTDPTRPETPDDRDPVRPTGSTLSRK